MLTTYRITCSTPAQAAAIAEYLTCEGYAACWLTGYDDNVPAVMTASTPYAVHCACKAVR